MSDSKERHVLNDRYEVERRIGRGGMADVFLARDLLLDRPVAIKVLFPEFAVDPNFVERFRREAQSAANLNHPNIVGVYDWGKYANTYFMAMEYVPGRTLADILKANGHVTSQKAAEIAINDFRSGAWGRITLETPEEFGQWVIEGQAREAQRQARALARPLRRGDRPKLDNPHPDQEPP